MRGGGSFTFGSTKDWILDKSLTNIDIFFPCFVKNKVAEKLWDYNAIILPPQTPAHISLDSFVVIFELFSGCIS